MVANGYAKACMNLQQALKMQHLGLLKLDKNFWSLVEGDHEDQIYIHQGHIVDGKFVRANSN